VAVSFPKEGADGPYVYDCALVLVQSYSQPVSGHDWSRPVAGCETAIYFHLNMLGKPIKVLGASVAFCARAPVASRLARRL
jgi:hypothetical protein